LSASVGAEALAAALAVLLLQPGPPLLFMGDEWGGREPFPFFCDFRAELADAVRAGRRREFAEAYAAFGDEIPDPLSPQTRASAVLDWSKRGEPEHARRLALTRELLAVRRRHIAPLIPAMVTPGTACFESAVLCALWPAGGRGLRLLANLSATAVERPKDLHWQNPIWGEAPPATLAPWSVYAAIGGA
jgi:maltooligosyltrehalose trehalohydrolase